MAEGHGATQQPGLTKILALQGGRFEAGGQGATAALRSPSVMLEASHNGCRPWSPEAS
nr:hypothetical protein RVX_2219 [Nitratidesulfovibrio sp. HK-II]